MVALRRYELLISLSSVEELFANVKLLESMLPLYSVSPHLLTIE